MPYNEAGVGYQTTDTSRAAAEGVSKKAPTLREQVLTVLHKSAFPMTTEEIAAALGRPYRSVQPRLSELRDMNRVRDSGTRKTGEFGTSIIAWEIA